MKTKFIASRCCCDVGPVVGLCDNVLEFTRPTSWFLQIDAGKILGLNPIGVAIVAGWEAGKTLINTVGFAPHGIVSAAGACQWGYDDVFGDDIWHLGTGEPRIAADIHVSSPFTPVVVLKYDITAPYDGSVTRRMVLHSFNPAAAPFGSLGLAPGVNLGDEIATATPQPPYLE